MRYCFYYGMGLHFYISQYQSFNNNATDAEKGNFKVWKTYFFWL